MNPFLRTRAALTFLLTLLVGCGTLPSDPVVIAEQTAKISFALADNFLLWEHANHTAIPVEVRNAADNIRDNWPKAWWNFRALTKAYKANRTPEGAANLDTARAVLAQLDAIIQQYAPQEVKLKAASEATKVRLD